MQAQGTCRLWGPLAGLRGAVRWVHRVLQLPIAACVGRSQLVPVPDVASVVVGAAGATAGATGTRTGHIQLKPRRRGNPLAPVM